MGKQWKVLPNCTFRTEDDGTGFVFNADNDRMHPVNKMATQLLRELSDGPATEKEIFERMWPHLEASIRDSVREDFRVFLRALSERGCLGAEGEEQEEDMMEAKSDIYSPPLVEEFGRRRRREIDPDEEPKSNDDKMQRRRFFAVGAGALAAMAIMPREAQAVSCATGEKPEDSVCDPGNSPQRGICASNGNTPEGENSPCWDVGSVPDDGSLYNDCDTGFEPEAGFCTSNGTQPSGEYGDCESAGYYPVPGGCSPTGVRPT